MQPQFFQTLADPMRLRIVEQLRHGEHAVNDLAGRVDIHQSGVSRHLRILQEAGFVQVRPDGQRRLYSLRPQPLREMEAWMRRYAHDEHHRLDRLAEFVERPEASSRQDASSKKARKTRT